MEQQLTSGLPQDKAPSQSSVAELAGRFKGPAAPSDLAGNETQNKPMRRRPPRSLHIPKAQADEQEPAGVTSPVPKAKRNSALIEKLQTNLALSPSAMLPSPKSPGFRLVAPGFSPLSPGSSPSTVTPTSPVTEEEGPVSFEDPLSAAEGSVLSNINKGRVRLSLRRRPPSRRHRKSSSGDEVNVPSDATDSTLASLSEPREGGQVFRKKEATAEVEDKTEEDQTKRKPKGDEEEEEKGSKGGKEESSTSGRREETSEKHNEGATTTEEDKKETSSTR